MDYGYDIEPTESFKAEVKGSVTGLSDEDKEYIKVGVIYSSESGKIEIGEGRKVDATDISDGGIMTGYYVYGKRGDSGLKITCWVDDANDTGLRVGEAATFEGVVREVTTVNNTEIALCLIK